MIPLPSLVESLAPLTAALDAASHDQRVNWMRGLGKRELVASWTLAEGRGVAKSWLHRGEGQVVIHEGQNSLPAFNRFQKRVVLFEGRVQGYNHQAMAWFTGPGHFLVAGDETDAWFDYTTVPPRAPAEFPPVVPNDGIPSRFVYGFMIDKLRQVAAEVVIGAAFRHGKATGDYFMLCRSPA